MCRLLAFSFSKETSQSDKVSCMNAFRQLSVTGNVPATVESGHADGWGLAVYTEESTTPRVYRSLSSASEDVTFTPEIFFSEQEAQSGLAHLRKKTVGDTSLPNTHPFVKDNYSFIHNGTVAKGDGPYVWLTPQCGGDTDSERLFLRFLELKESGIVTREAFIQMVNETRKSYPTFSAINAILHEGSTIYVSRIINKNYPRYNELHLENYYTLYVGTTTKGTTLISSEKIPCEDVSYTLIPNDTVYILDSGKNTSEMVTLE